MRNPVTPIHMGTNPLLHIVKTFEQSIATAFSIQLFQQPIIRETLLFLNATSTENMIKDLPVPVVSIPE